MEYQVTADPVTGTFTQTAALTGTNFTTAVDIGDIMAAAGILFKNGFECGTTDMWSSTFP